MPQGEHDFYLSTVLNLVQLELNVSKDAKAAIQHSASSAVSFLAFLAMQKGSRKATATENLDEAVRDLKITGLYEAFFKYLEDQAKKAAAPAEADPAEEALAENNGEQSASATTPNEV